MQLKKSKAKAPLSPKASREHAAQHRTKAHFFVLYALIVLLTLALAIGGFFMYILWNERDDNNRFIVSEMVSDSIRGSYRPAQQISTKEVVLPGLGVVVPTETPDLWYAHADESGLLITTGFALGQVRSYLLSQQEPFEGVPKAQKCSAGYIIKDAAKDYWWRSDVQFTEIARTETGDGRTIVVEKNTDELCGDAFPDEIIGDLDSALKNLYSYER